MQQMLIDNRVAILYEEEYSDEEGKHTCFKVRNMDEIFVEGVSKLKLYSMGHKGCVSRAKFEERVKESYGLSKTRWEK